MLIEQSPVVRRRSRLPKWLWVIGALFLGVIALATVLLATHWPFTETAVTQALEAASGRDVRIRTFSQTYFPPGCIAGGISFLRHKHPEAQPVITVERLVVQGSIIGMLSSPNRLS